MSTDAVVFVIDNEADSREAVASLARAKGLRTEAFASAAEFLESHRDQPGCVVADVRLKGPGGGDLLEELRRQGDWAALVGLIGRPDTATVAAAMRGGAVTVLDKPPDPDQLWQAIGEAQALDAQRRSRREQTRQLQKRFEALTDKERDVLGMIIAGKPNKAMANALGASLRTVENRRREVFSKLGVRSVAELVALALKAEQASGL